MATLDLINELRAELRSCYFTKAERAAAEAELEAMMQQHAAEEAAFEAFLSAEPS